MSEFEEFPERWWKVLTEVGKVANEIDATPAQVAIKWVSRVDGVTSAPIIGSTSVNQLNETLKYVDLTLSEDQHQRISDAGNFADRNPHAYTYTYGRARTTAHTEWGRWSGLLVVGLVRRG